MPSPGTVLNGRYQLTERIAAGGMGEVWRADDLLLRRVVAVKVLLPALMADAGFTARFRAEARMLAALRHPGIVQVHDYGESAEPGHDRFDYAVMEFIDGTPLSESGRLDPAATMAVVVQVADALEAAHRAGIVHRDVKPSNLLVRPDGAIVLVDFGVARSAGVTALTGTGVVLGTVHYMAPEQAEGRPVSAATDVYALGAVAFTCLTGRPPYVGDSPVAVLVQLMHGAPPVLPPDVPAPVAALVLRALAKDPGHRFASAAEMAEAARATDTDAEEPPPRRGRLMIVAAGVLVIGAAIGLGRGLSDRHPDPVPGSLGAGVSTSSATPAPDSATLAPDSAAPAPASATPVTAATAANPYDPATLCKNGLPTYRVLASKQLTSFGGVLQGTTYLLYAERDLSYCVVTVKAGTAGTTSAVGVNLMHNKRFGTWGDGKDHANYAVTRGQGCTEWTGSVGATEYTSEDCS
ncbi:serine/threonine-protein kinase [Actinoplanes palleronii]|uniref:non-specific serine/threonine protein kinase n=1 Tax=Actinoplanes palleronii TaxID=113570 RepID=A0ABQ4BCY8_9ACTN|nr:serine/threonine-protein kinase [Actinoplanes palleronii]GIE68125.1 hypothetical protein Apa02nite_042330 [Actinoplanes palleronii]